MNSDRYNKSLQLNFLIFDKTNFYTQKRKAVSLENLSSF